MSSCNWLRAGLVMALLLVNQSALAWFGKEKDDDKVYASSCADSLAGVDGSVVVRGYGQGASFQQAKAEALKDISERISVQVTGKSVSTSQLNNGESSSSFQSSARIDTRLRIQQAVQVCSDNGDPSGDWHVVFEFDTRSAVQQLAATLNKSLAGNRVRLEGNPYLLGSQLINELRAGLHVGHGQNAQPLSLSLKRQHGGWYLVAGDQQVRLSDDDIFQSMHFAGSSELILSLIKTADTGQQLDQLLVGDQFSLRVDSTLEGFLSIFNVYADGRVSVLAANQPIDEGGLKILPGGSMTYEAGLLESGKTARDFYLAIVTDERIQSATLHHLRESHGMVEGESSYQLHRLFDLLHDSHPSVSSLVITTLPL
ncbi:LPP20 family lipoprotein [Alcanivorax sp. DP30]|uniref:LPP20 family lipoprotein n=1 Tax=Alcanivorax sp. DP30 TaxID=2606217 RepID=UPI00136D803F|nr:LPP20 family lipoprotein [Alcanivorax sp. DP30]MZR63752.1 hypothetical protein [Alcanivorax sp. DP30]